MTLSVASSTTLLVSFDEPEFHNDAVVTRYKGKQSNPLYERQMLSSTLVTFDQDLSWSRGERGREGVERGPARLWFVPTDRPP